MDTAWMNAATQEAGNAEPQVAVAVPVVPGRRFHVDGDMIAYWAGGNDDMDVATSRSIALNKIEKCQHQAGAESTVLHLTAATSTKADRFLIATVKPYQGQRKSGRKPKNWEYLRSFMEGYQGPAFRTKLWATREADDGFAMMAYLSPNDVFMTADKDMRMLPGWHMSWKDMSMVHVPVGTFDLVHNGLQYGTKWFWLQMLQGDTADNIPGLPKYVTPAGTLAQCGEATAAKLLADCHSDEEAEVEVRGHYRRFYGEDEWADRYVEQAALLWLRPDKDAGYVTLWKMVGRHPHAEAAINRMRLRIKEKYIEAHRITGVSPARQDVG